MDRFGSGDVRRRRCIVARPGNVAAAAVLVVFVLSTLVPAARAGAGVGITEIPVPSGSSPGPIVADPGGGAWFAMPGDHRIGRVWPNGVVVEFPLPSPYEEPRGIAVGPDGATWFTQTGGHTGSEGIGRIDGSGTIVEHPLPDQTLPFAIAAGPDGNLWFTALGSEPIGRITPGGVVTMFPGDLQGDPLNITSGPDGALWFTEDGIVRGSVGAIGRVTTTGVVTEYPLPTPAGSTSGAGDLAVGPDGNLWFTWAVRPLGGPVGSESLRIGRITPAGAITSFTIWAAQGWPPGGVTRGPDGDLWFTAVHANVVARITTDGAVSTLPVPTMSAGPSDISAGPDGLWFTEGSASKIGRILPVVRPPIVPPAPSITSFAPSSGRAGTAVAIAGSNLGGTTDVRFNGTRQPAFTVDPTGTLITTTVPAGASTGPIVVSTAGGSAVSSSAFVVMPDPVTHVRNVTLTLHGHLGATGRIVVADGSAACRWHRYVRIQRHGHRGWTTVGGDLTNAAGRYALILPDRSGWYRAVIRRTSLADGDACAAATSGTRRHAV